MKKIIRNFIKWYYGPEIKNALTVENWLWFWGAIVMIFAILVKIYQLINDGLLF